MTTSPTPLHMISLELEPRALPTMGRLNRLPLRRVDDEYLTHCLLGELFGEDAPAPFVLEAGSQRRHPRVLGYATSSLEVLQGHAQMFANPALYKGVRWQDSASKPMPERFVEGTRMGFRLRACPVVRQRPSGREADVFVLAREGNEAYLDDEQSAEAVTRDRVYTRWLVQRLHRQGGAHVESARLEGFEMAQVFRRGAAREGGARASRAMHRPAAVLTGALEVRDGAQFRALLEQGASRHKISGFGMVLLQRLGA